MSPLAMSLRSGERSGWRRSYPPRPNRAPERRKPPSLGQAFGKARFLGAGCPSCSIWRSSRSHGRQAVRRRMRNSTGRLCESLRWRGRSPVGWFWRPRVPPPDERGCAAHVTSESVPDGTDDVLDLGRSAPCSARRSGRERDPPKRPLDGFSITIPETFSFPVGTRIRGGVNAVECGRKKRRAGAAIPHPLRSGST